MRTFVIVLLVLIALTVTWKYVGDYVTKRALQVAPVSAVNDSLNTVGGYAPTQIKNEQILKGRINDSVQKENDRLQQSLDGTQQ